MKNLKKNKSLLTITNLKYVFVGLLTFLSNIFVYFLMFLE